MSDAHSDLKSCFRLMEQFSTRGLLMGQMKQLGVDLHPEEIELPTAIVSMAISLKRIADALEWQNKTHQKMIEQAHGLGFGAQEPTPDVTN